MTEENQVAESDASQPSPRIAVTQDIGEIDGGKVVGAQIGSITGDLSIESTVNQIEAKIVQGDYIDRREITNIILTIGPDALPEIINKLATMQGVDKRGLQRLEAHALPEHVSRQIAEVEAAQKESAARGVALKPDAAYQLGMLAAYNRKYETALDYFRQAAQADPEYSDAFEAIAWLQQSRAMEEIDKGNLDGAMSRLADARTAGTQTDPRDPNALALRGYISKTLAHIAEARHESGERQKFYEEAAEMFEHVIKLDPKNAAAHNGLGNVQYALGRLDQAIAEYDRAIKLLPIYTAAYHDLALAYEGKMKTDAAHADQWRRKALRAWEKAYQLAPNDGGFSADQILVIGQRIAWLERQH